MSGHSKWSTIKHQKAATDKKRGKIFSKLSKVISIAVKDGGSGDPEFNAKLRLAMDQAKAVNMPKENIKRAIEKGLGKEGGSELQAILYEGFGPEKTALIVECITDNKNRTAAEIKSYFDKGGGSLGSPGSAAYLFDKKGMILLDKEKDVEQQLLKLIDLEVDDVEEAGQLIEVYVQPEQLEIVKKKVVEAGFNMVEALIVYRPKTLLEISDKKKSERIINFLEGIEDFDDVQKVYCNADFVE